MTDLADLADVAEAKRRIEARLRREHNARLEAERIAENATRDLYETIRELQQAQQVQAETTKLVAVLQRVAVAANEAQVLEDAARVALAEVCSHAGWPIGHLYVLAEPGRLAPSGVWHLDETGGWPSFVSRTDATEFFAGEGLPGRVLVTGAPAWIGDLSLDNNFPRAASAAQDGVRSGFAFPVLVGAEVVGVLEFFACEVLDPNEAMLEIMPHVGAQLGRVVERQRGADALRASNAHTRQVIETANDAFVAIDTNGLIIDWNGQAEIHFGWSKDEALGRSLTETIIPEIHRDAHNQGISRFMATGEGPVLGRRVELEAVHRDGHTFPIELAAWAVADAGGVRFNAFIHDITERKAFAAQLEHQSLHDSLTGLPNRALLLDRLRVALDRSRRDASSVALLFFDLDRFKAVNDSLGHEAGDHVLQGVAARVPVVLRAGDTLARLSGDEFVVLCEKVESAETAMEVARRVLLAVEAPFVIGTHDVFVSASIGVAVTGNMRVTAEELLADADLAMYRAKDRGKATYELFDKDLRTRVVERHRTERALRDAIDGDQLEAYFQPVVELQAGRVIGYEALVRWQHPERGLLAPAAFISLAEDSSLISRIGEWMLDQGCATVRTMLDTMPPGEAPWVAVNLSVRELEQRHLVENVAAVLSKHDVPPESLVLEVTESAVMHDAKAVLRRLWELRELGVRLAIDDFGTGYSSLDRLRRMPVDTLKVDRSFVADMDATAGGASLVAAIIAMSHSVGLSVVAEGVETVEQLDQLRRLGADHAQGYLIARPAPFDSAGAVKGVALSPIDDAADDIEAELRRLVEVALRERHDVGRTTRSLLAELRRIAEVRESSLTS